MTELKVLDRQSRRAGQGSRASPAAGVGQRHMPEAPRDFGSVKRAEHVRRVPLLLDSPLRDSPFCCPNWSARACTWAHCASFFALIVELCYTKLLLQPPLCKGGTVQGCERGKRAKLCLDCLACGSTHYITPCPAAATAHF